MQVGLDPERSCLTVSLLKIIRRSMKIDDFERPKLHPSTKRWVTVPETFIAIDLKQGAAVDRCNLTHTRPSRSHFKFLVLLIKKEESELMSLCPLPRKAKSSAWYVRQVLDAEESWRNRNNNIK